MKKIYLSTKPPRGPEPEYNKPNRVCLGTDCNNVVPAPLWLCPQCKKVVDKMSSVENFTNTYRLKGVDGDE